MELRWDTYRPRDAVQAARLAGPYWLDGRYHRDGYLVRDDDGRVIVVDVAEFEAVYRPSENGPDTSATPTETLVSRPWEPTSP